MDQIPEVSLEEALTELSKSPEHQEAMRKQAQEVAKIQSTEVGGREKTLHKRLASLVIGQVDETQEEELVSEVTAELADVIANDIFYRVCKVLEGRGHTNPSASLLSKIIVELAGRFPTLLGSHQI